MDKLDIDLVAPCATKEQAEEIMRRSRAGQMGTICPPRSVRESIYYYRGIGRFRWLRQLIHTLRYGCD